MPIPAILSTLSDIAGLLKLVSEVSTFIGKYANQSSTSVARGTTKQRNERKEQQEALQVTYDEWEHLAFALEPRLRDDLSCSPNSSLNTKANILAASAAKYADSPRQHHQYDLSHLEIQHSKIEATSDNIQAHLGQSPQTRVLFNNVLRVPIKSGGRIMSLPVFKITMLGGSGTGKTVFMASMYRKLCIGIRSLSLRAIDMRIDKELQDHMNTLYQQNKWPAGTELPKVQYEFELRLKERAIARIDWIDYRGGILSGTNRIEDENALLERLNQSHAIIWMVDMSNIPDMVEIDSDNARGRTNIARMAQYSRQAIANNSENPRAWIFARTKSDTVLGTDGKPDWDRACTELCRHLGDTLAVTRAGKNTHTPCGALLPVSAAGRLKSNGELMGDDSAFVVWPLILSIAFLMNIERERLTLQHYMVGRQLNDTSKDLLSFFYSFLGLGTTTQTLSDEELLRALSKNCRNLERVAAALLKDLPSVVRIIGKDIKLSI